MSEKIKIINDVALTYDDVNIVPLYTDIKSRRDINIKTKLTKNYSINTPIIASPMDTVTGEDMMFEMWRLGGIAILHRFISLEEQIKIIKNLMKRISEYKIRYYSENNALIGVSIGVKDIDIDNAKRLLECGANIILIDIAHGHCEMMKNTLSKLNELKKDYKFDIIAGNVATPEATKDLIEWGADAVRVGIGGGSVCTTRKKSGSGVPMITSIMECAFVAEEFGVPIIADGGIRYEGDVAKAIGAGADTVMLGSLLAGTDESPGDLIDVSYE